VDPVGAGIGIAILVIFLLGVSVFLGWSYYLYDRVHRQHSKPLPGAFVSLEEKDAGSYISQGLDAGRKAPKSFLEFLQQRYPLPAYLRFGEAAPPLASVVTPNPIAIAGTPVAIPASARSPFSSGGGSAQPAKSPHAALAFPTLFSSGAGGAAPPLSSDPQISPRA
jgi:hypothetical protein